MTKPIYLTLHFKETKKAIAMHINNYNQQLRFENPNGYNKLKIKSPVVQTIHAILNAYSKFLYANAKNGITNPVFKINNKALCTMLDGLRSEVTIWRHIKQATVAGILDKNKYVFHGSNSSFEIGFNSSLLVACQSEEYSDLLLNTYNANVNNPPITVSNCVDMKAARPLFIDTFNGCMLSFCKDIVPVKPLQEQYINMDKDNFVDKGPTEITPKEVSKNAGSSLSHLSFEIVNKIEMLSNALAFDKNRNIQQEHESWNYKCSIKNVVEKIKLQEHNNKQEQAARFKIEYSTLVDKNKNIQQEQESWNYKSPKKIELEKTLLAKNRSKQEQVAPAKIEKNQQNTKNELLKLYTERCLAIASRVLFPDRTFDDTELEIASRHIHQYFTSSNDKPLSQLYNDFNLVIYEAHKSKSRNMWLPAPIYKYFDSQFNGGFYRTLVHVQDCVKPYMEKNTEFKKSIQELIKLQNLYMKNPNDLMLYRKAILCLDKKKNKTYLNIFNACVLKEKSLNSKSIQNLFIQSLH